MEAMKKKETGLAAKKIFFQEKKKGKDEGHFCRPAKVFPTGALKTSRSTGGGPERKSEKSRPNRMGRQVSEFFRGAACSREKAAAENHEAQKAIGL